MDIKQFKKCVNAFMERNGLEKKGSFFYKFADDIVCSIGLQKSSYSSRYYINVGFFVIELDNTLLYPRDVDGHIRTRFTTIYNGKLVDFFDIVEFECDNELCQCLQQNFDSLSINCLALDSLKLLLKSKPVLLYQTKPAAKIFFGFTER